MTILRDCPSWAQELSRAGRLGRSRGALAWCGRERPATRASPWSHRSSGGRPCRPDRAQGYAIVSRKDGLSRGRVAQAFGPAAERDTELAKREPDNEGPQLVGRTSLARLSVEPRAKECVAPPAQGGGAKASSGKCQESAPSRRPSRGVCRTPGMSCGAPVLFTMPALPRQLHPPVRRRCQ